MLKIIFSSVIIMFALFPSTCGAGENDLPDIQKYKVQAEQALNLIVEAKTKLAYASDQLQQQLLDRIDEYISKIDSVIPTIQTARQKAVEYGGVASLVGIGDAPEVLDAIKDALNKMDVFLKDIKEKFSKWNGILKKHQELDDAEAKLRKILSLFNSAENKLNLLDSSSE